MYGLKKKNSMFAIDPEEVQLDFVGLPHIIGRRDIDALMQQNVARKSKMFDVFESLDGDKGGRVISEIGESSGR